MRQLQKGPKPEILARNEDTWTDEYVAARQVGTESRHEHWRHPEIKAGVKAETSGKCAYCEIISAGGAYPHVEHIIPKSVHPELAHHWPNLTWVCPLCNGNKGDYYHQELPVLNPYVDDIAAHIEFLGGLVSPRLGGGRGEITVKQLRLNRMDLAYARIDRLTKIQEMLERWNEAAEPLRGVLARAIRLDAVEGEFTATVIQYLQYVGFPLSDLAT